MVLDVRDGLVVFFVLSLNRMKKCSLLFAKEQSAYPGEKMDEFAEI
jgi:hypothetical protein